MTEFPSILNKHMAEALTRRLDAPSFVGTLVNAEYRVNKLGPRKRNEFAIRVSREMALDYGLVEPTAEEAAERAKRAEVWRQTRRAGHEQTAAYVAALDALTDPVARIVLDLHDSNRTGDYPECSGCEFAGFEGEPPPWPCATVDAIADHYGLERPIYVTFWEQQ